mmetsp:Transcript_10594/g.43814  ORF Transcript_10594/g.43814 Transcript_10594/m.43814 type:complete len:222 (-) Transcript_10594:1201-1866(-)
MKAPTAMPTTKKGTMLATTNIKASAHAKDMKRFHTKKKKALTSELRPMSQYVIDEQMSDSRKRKGSDTMALATLYAATPYVPFARSRMKISLSSRYAGRTLMLMNTLKAAMKNRTLTMSWMSSACVPICSHTVPIMIPRAMYIAKRSHMYAGFLTTLTSMRRESTTVCHRMEESELLPAVSSVHRGAWKPLASLSFSAVSTASPLPVLSTASSRCFASELS